MRAFFRPRPARNSWHALALVMVAVLLIVLRVQGERYFTNPLTLDEAWNIDAAQYGILSADVHAPFYPLLLKIWLALAGDSTLAVRMLSSLLALLTIAIVYRLAADLFDRRAGLFAALIMATWSYFVYYGVMARPFALLAFLSALTILVFVRWMRQSEPTKRWFAAFVLCSLMLTYTHLYGPFLLIALAICGLLRIRKEAQFILLYFALFLTFILSGIYILFKFDDLSRTDHLYTPRWLWGEPLSFAALFDNILPLGNYAAFVLILSAAALLFNLLKYVALNETDAPRELAFKQALLNLTPVLLVTVCTFCSSLMFLALKASLPTQTIDLALIVPVLAIGLAYGVSRLPMMFGGALLIIYVVSGARLIPDALEETPPYREVVDYLAANLTPDEPILIDLGPTPRDYVLFEYYYLAAGLIPENLALAHVWIGGASLFQVFPFSYGELYYGSADAFRQSIANVTENTPRFTVVSWYESDFNRDLMRLIGDRYVEARFTEYGPIHIYEYFEQFTPTDADVLFTFDDMFVLARADFPTSVPACSQLNVTTWWTLSQGASPQDNYSMGLYLQDSGGVTQSQADGSPAGIETLTWEHGRAYPDQRSLTVPCAPGRYDIRVTLYQPFTVTNLPVTDANGEPIGTVATLGSIEVVP